MRIQWMAKQAKQSIVDSCLPVSFSFSLEHHEGNSLFIFVSPSTQHGSQHTIEMWNKYFMNEWMSCNILELSALRNSNGTRNWKCMRRQNSIKDQALNFWVLKNLTEFCLLHFFFLLLLLLYDLTICLYFSESYFLSGW